ncbi:hypothetical protein [Nonomuraea typhae]|uniref:hypothetical protein n=1 Tax=Nonomuraea typhae TaxID=2603600 RepID=UPI0012FC9BEE|nr:hypothetical protein [Nonomuraea typhae]
MDRASLTEMREAEIEKAHQIATRLSAQRDIASSRDLYPELALTSPYTYCVGSIRPVDLLPFFNTVITDLRPLPTSEHFESRYGLTVRQFIDLIEQGRLAVRLRADHLQFSALEYLAPLFSEHLLPRSDRYKVLYHDKMLMHRIHAREIFAGTEAKGRRWLREYLDWLTPPQFADVVSDKFALVATYCGVGQAERIVERTLSLTGDPAVSYDWLHIYSRFRIYPYMNSLDGINVLPAKEVDLLPVELRPDKSSYLPYEVGRALLCNLPIDPRTDLSQAGCVSADDWLRTLRELDSALAASAPGAIHEWTARLHELVASTRREVTRMRQRRESLEQKFLIVSGIGIAGALSEYAPPHWKPIIGAGSAAIFSARAKIADTIVKFRKQSHVLAWFDLQNEILSNMPK